MAQAEQIGRHQVLLHGHVLLACERLLLRRPSV
jgi:hypothetical protein